MVKTLVCTKCLKEKQLEQFVKSKLVKCGHTSTCLECHRKIRNQRDKAKTFPPVEYKKCPTCGKILSKKSFYLSPRMSSGLSTECQECTKLRQQKNRINRGDRDKLKTKERYAKNIDKRRAEKRNYMLANPERHMFLAAKGRAKRKGIDFNLDINDIIIQKECPILKVPYIRGTKGNYSYSPSLDRIDNSKGYIKGNIQIISSLANTMKNSASTDELIQFAKYILDTYNDDIVRPTGN